MFHLNQGCYDVDSPAFDAKVYYEQLITTASLPTLLNGRTSSCLVCLLRSVYMRFLTLMAVEVRQLDSERQSLVYNHHHELIAASDTIAAVSVSAYRSPSLWL